MRQFGTFLILLTLGLGNAHAQNPLGEGIPISNQNVGGDYNSNYQNTIYAPAYNTFPSSSTSVHLQPLPQINLSQANKKSAVQTAPMDADQLQEILKPKLLITPEIWQELQDAADENYEIAQQRLDFINAYELPDYAMYTARGDNTLNVHIRQPVFIRQLVDQKNIVNADPHHRPKYIKTEFLFDSHKKPYLFKNLPFAKFSYCDYLYDDLGYLIDNGSCIGLGGGKYYSLFSLKSFDWDPKVTAEKNQKEKDFWVTVGEDVAITALAFYSAGLSAEATLLWSGLRRTALYEMLTTNVIRREAFVKTAAITSYFQVTFGDSVVPFNTQDLVQKYALMKQILNEYYLTHNNLVWYDNSSLHINSDDPELTQEKNALESLLDKRFKAHNEICKDCMVHCYTAEERSRQMTMVAGGYSTASIGNVSPNDFFLCDNIK